MFTSSHKRGISILIPISDSLLDGAAVPDENRNQWESDDERYASQVLYKDP